MRKTALLRTALAAGLGLAALPVLADPPPGRGHGHEPPERSAPETPPPGNSGNNPGHGGTPPGLGGNQPPGHGGPNPGRGHSGVPRGNTRICGADGATAVGPLGQAGASHVAHVNFAPPDDSDSDSWARAMYFWIGSSFDYVLNAHQVEPGSEWTLIARAADDSAICLGDGTANPGGQLHLADSIELDSHLPDDLDPFEPTPEGEDPAGTALELVPSDAVDCDAGTVTLEDGDEVLTSEHDIRFVDVDEVECPS